MAFTTLILPAELGGQTIIQPSTIAQNDLFARDLAIQGNTLIGSTNNFNETNRVHAFRLNGGTWEEDGVLVHGDLVNGDQYGRSIDVYGDYAVVGAASANDDGRAYVFKRVAAGQWELDQTLVSSDIASEDEFGLSVSIHETTILVGAGNKNNGTGAAYIFELQGGQWVETAKLTSNTTSSSRYGHFSSLYGDYAAVAAHQNEKVFIFKRNGSSWEETEVLITPDGNDNSFGVTVSLYKDRLLVGSLRDDDVANNAGAAYVYKRNGEDWDLEQKLTASDGADGRNFGGRIALGDRYAVIGTLYDVDFYTGSAYIFRRDGNTWTEIEKYTTSGDDYFGWTTAADANYAVVGAYAADVNLLNEGAAYVYELPDLSAVFAPEKQAFQLELMPNPSTGLVELKWPATVQVNSLQLFDPAGKLLFQPVAVVGQLDLSTLPAGHYWLRAVSEQGAAWQLLIRQ